MLNALLQKSSYSRTKLESLIGFLLFAAKIIFLSRAFLRRFYNLQASSNFFIYIILEVKLDLL